MVDLAPRWVLCGGATHRDAPKDALCIGLGEGPWHQVTVNIEGLESAMMGRLPAALCDLIRIAAYVLAASRRGVDVACRAHRDAYITSTLLEAGVAPIAGWGAHPMAAVEQHTVLKLAGRWMTLRLTAGGAPGHPLYLPGYLEPVEWAYPGMVKR